MYVIADVSNKLYTQGDSQMNAYVLWNDLLKEVDEEIYFKTLIRRGRNDATNKCLIVSRIFVEKQHII